MANPMSRPADCRSWLSASLALVVLSACSPVTTDVANVPSTTPSMTVVTETVKNAPRVEAQPSTTVKPASPKSTTPSTQISEPGKQPALQSPSTLSEVATVTKILKRETAKPVKAAPQPAAKATTTSAPQVATFKSTQQMAGFSADGRHFMYLESSRDTGAGIPKSTMQVMDLMRNTCVENGCVKTNFGEQDANRSTAEAETELLQRTAPLRQNLEMTSLKSGTLLPIQARSRTPDGTEVVTLQLNNRPLQIQLRQTTLKSPLRGGTAETDRSAMQLEVTYEGQKRTLDSLSNYRDWVFDYSIREVRLSPNGKTIAILLTATQTTFEGTLATTLVQGLTF